MNNFQARLNENYLLKIRMNPEGNWGISLDGPRPIRRHDEFITDFEEARITAHALAIWHFGQKGIHGDIPTEWHKLTWDAVPE